jgi:hypothetical protein
MTDWQKPVLQDAANNDKHRYKTNAMLLMMSNCQRGKYTESD